MKTVKLGKLNVEQYVAEKPVGIRSDGTLIYPTDLMKRSAAPSLGLAMASKDNKIKLALARIKLEPDFELGVLDSGGKYSKKDVIKHINDQTVLGMQLVNMEVQYAEHFSNQMMGKELMDELSAITDKISSVAKSVVDAIPKEWLTVPKVLWPIFKNKVLFCENTTDGVTTPAANYRIANVHPVFAAKGFEDKVKGVWNKFHKP